MCRFLEMAVHESTDRVKDKPKSRTEYMLIDFSNVGLQPVHVVWRGTGEASLLGFIHGGVENNKSRKYGTSKIMALNMWNHWLLKFASKQKTKCSFAIALV